MPRPSRSPVDQRRTGADRRTGRKRRSGIERRALLQQLFPHAGFAGGEAGDPAEAIEAHRREMTSRLGRDVGLSVAALDYRLNVAGDLFAPTILEREVLQALEQCSVTDPLSGLLTRPHFEAAFRREVARSLRRGTQISLLLLDVDQLQAVKDRQGREGKTETLRRVGSAIRNSLRGSDIACRYTENEFAVLLPDTDVRAGRRVAERICTKVGMSFEDGIVLGFGAEAGAAN